MILDMVGMDIPPSTRCLLARRHQGKPMISLPTDLTIICERERRRTCLGTSATEARQSPATKWQIFARAAARPIYPTKEKILNRSAEYIVIITRDVPRVVNDTTIKSIR